MTGNIYLYAGNRPIYDYFVEQHDRLLAEIEQVRTYLDDPQPERLAEQLLELRQTFIDHVRHEEEEGFDQLVAQCPYLAAEAREIEAQHEDLLGHLDAVIDALHDPLDDREVAQRFDVFERYLGAHEAQERDPYRRAFILADGNY